MLIPFLKAEVALYSAKSLLLLAYLIDEENNHLIMANEGKPKGWFSRMHKHKNKQHSNAVECF